MMMITASLPGKYRPSQNDAFVSGRFSVIMPLFNSADCVRRSLNSVLAAVQEYGNAEIIVVDNGSEDGSDGIVACEYPEVRIYHLANSTISAVRNFGARVSKGEYLAFIDSDCVISSSFFGEALKTFTSVPCEATGSMCALPASPCWVEQCWQSLNERSGDGYVNYLNSGNFVIRRQSFLQVGGFDESLTTGEDYDIGRRLHKYGSGVYESHCVRAVHLRNPKTLGEFFRRHSWHGQCILAPFKNSWLNKPFCMTLLHLILIIAGVAITVAPRVPIETRAALTVLTFNLVPLVTSVYRMSTLRRLSPLLPALIIYHTYFAAKLYGIACLLLGRGSRTYR